MIANQRECYFRSILGACCALAASAAAAQALVRVDLLEKVSGAPVVHVPPSGGNYDVAVRLDGSENTRGVRTAALRFAASSVGFITVTGEVNGRGASGTGTRYNSPSWDSLFDGNNYPPAFVAGPLGVLSKGPYGSEIIREDPYFALSTMGWVNVTLSPAAPGSRVTLRGIDVEVYDAGVELIPGTSVNTIEFVYVPEPAALVLCAAAALVLPRRWMQHSVVVTG